MLETAVAFGVVAFTMLVVYYVLRTLHSPALKEETIAIQEEKATLPQAKTTKTQLVRKPTTKSVFKHEWVNTTLKGPSGQLHDVILNPSDKFLLASSSDGSCTLWNLKTKDTGIRSYKIPIEGDIPNKLAFSPDSKALLVSLNMSNKIRIIKIGKKEDGSPGNFQAISDIGEAHSCDICDIGIATSGQFVMVAFKDTMVNLYTPKGVLLKKIDTGHNINYQATISPCGRFVATCGFTPDVKVWEVSFSKSNDFREVKRVYELKGHNAGVLTFSFSADSTRVVTASKDGTWRLYDINIDHVRGEDPHFLSKAQHSFKEDMKIALSGDSLTVALAQGSKVLFYNAGSGQLVREIDSVFTGSCVSMFFDSKNVNLYVAGDRQVVIFNNIPGFEARIQHWTEMRSRPTHANNRAMRDRCDQEIAEAKQLLEKFGAKVQK
jgi:transducin beta-like protein 2